MATSKRLWDKGQTVDALIHAFTVGDDPVLDRRLVHFDVLDAGRERFRRSSLFLRAGLVFLGAGALGSTEISLRSREHGLDLSPRLGSRFSGNGDVLGFAYNCESRVNGIGFGNKILTSQVAVGPCITGVIDSRDPNGPLGAKEASEGALAGFLPALTNAVADAIGIRPHELPVTPDAIFEALRKRRRAEKLKAA